MSSIGGSGLPPAIVQDAAAGGCAAAAASGLHCEAPGGGHGRGNFWWKSSCPAAANCVRRGAFLVFDPRPYGGRRSARRGPGRIPVTLTAPAGWGRCLRLRAVGGSGTATLHLDDVGVTDQGGTPQAVSPTAELKIQVGA